MTPYRTESSEPITGAVLIKKIETMKKYIYILGIIILLVPARGNAVIPVTDYAHITQSIVNSAQQLIQTSTTATNMINNCAPV